MALADQIREIKGLTTPGELADLLDVSWKTVICWIKKGGLPAAKIAGSWWLEPEVAAAWFEKRFASRPRKLH